MSDEIKHLKDLKPDPRNARKHNPRNVGMIETALQTVGAARSIVVDENGVVLAGNATIEAAAAVGIERVQVVDADGETIIAVRRKGLTPEQKTKLALFDNRTAELAEWDVSEVLATLNEGVNLDALWRPDELEALVQAASVPAADEWGAAIGGLPAGEKSPFQQMTFTVSDEQAEQVKRALDAAKKMGPFVDTGTRTATAMPWRGCVRCS
jgi:hypothetical protein